MNVSDRTAPPNRPGMPSATAARRHRETTPFLTTSAVAACLAGLVAAELTTRHSDPPYADTVPVTAIGHVAAQPGARPVPAETLLARPLFSAARRPAPGEATVSVTAALGESPHLVGTLLTGSHERTALLALTASEKLRAVHEGDTLGLYRITQISPGEVLADGPAGRVRLRMGPRRPDAERPQPVTIEAAHAAVGAPDQDE